MHTSRQRRYTQPKKGKEKPDNPQTWEAFCPQRRRQDLSPPLRPPEGRDVPAEGSMNVFLVNSPHALTPGSPGAWYFASPEPTRFSGSSYLPILSYKPLSPLLHTEPS